MKYRCHETEEIRNRERLPVETENLWEEMNFRLLMEQLNEIEENKTGTALWVDKISAVEILQEHKPAKTGWVWRITRFLEQIKENLLGRDREQI